MAPVKISLSNIIFIVFALIGLYGGFMIFLHPVALFPDPSWGFRIMQDMQRGGGFNILIQPSQQNIAENHSSFISWWSPGQYLLPYIFISFFHVNIGKACAITITVCNLLGLWGYYRLFRKCGFSKKISAVSIAFIASQVFYFIPFVFYNGGEVLIFAFAGWFLYGCLKFDNSRNWQTIVFILLSGWLGFFCKSSFLWIYFAGLLFMWIRASQKQHFKKWLVNGVYLAVPAILSLAGIYFGYLSRGLTPASDAHSVKLLWETLGFPIASPLLAGFSVDEILHGLLYHTDAALLTYSHSVIVILILAALSVLVVGLICKNVPGTAYRLMLVVFYVVCILFFGVSFFKQLAISYEARHLRIIGLLIIPGLIYLISNLKVGFKLLFGALWLFILFSSVKFVIEGFERNISEQSHGVAGITQQFLDQDALDQVIKLDRTSSNAVFVFISPDLGLEVQHNRVITLPPISQDMRVNYDEYQHCGHNGPLYIFLPSTYKGAKATMILKSFEDYKGFHFTQLSEDYCLFAAK